MADSLQDLGARLIAIAQALASVADQNADQLRSLMPAQVGDRLAATQTAIESAANGVLQRATDQLAAVEAAKAAAEHQAEALEQQTRARLDQQLKEATDQADRAVAAAEAGLAQAKAMGDQALAAATETRDAAVRKAEQSKADAQAAFDDAAAQAEHVTEQAKQAADKAVAEATKAVTDAGAQVGQAADAARAAVDDAVAAAAGLPGEATALAQDTLERLEGALTWPSGILSLLAKVLIWLKKECFADVTELQVIWHEPAGDHAAEPAGLGLQWVDNATTLRLVYRPPVPPAVGAGTLLIESTGADSTSFASADGMIAVSFHGHGGQRVVVGKSEPPPTPGTGDAQLVVTFDPKFNRQFGPLSAIVDKPVLTIKFAQATAWSYDVKLDLPSYGATLSLSELLDQAGLPIPITVPSIDERRSLSLRVTDGKFSIHEGASA